MSQNTVADFYEIGDTGPGGGIVFYYSEAGFTFYESHTASPRLCHYLECSPVELGLITWCPCGTSKWCNVYMNDGTNGAGAGKLNTNRILNTTHEKGLTPQNCAAKACSVYSTETTKAGEWYLPSRFELRLIYNNLRKNGKIISDSVHWSSSQDGSSDAYACRFSDGYETDHYKYKYQVVRAVRAF